MSKRVLLINQFFQPEPNDLRGLEFAKELSQRGFHVEVLTGFPNYPTGTLYPGYRMRPYAAENVDGITVHRVAHVLSHGRSGFARALSYVSLMIAVMVFLGVRRKRIDLIWVQQGPATLGAAAALWSRLSRRPFVLDVQDLWPESVTTSGMLPNWVPERAIAGFSRRVAKSADAIVTLSPGAVRRLVELGVANSDITLIYNWCPEKVPDGTEMQSARDLLGQVKESFVVTYVGSLGLLQDLGTVVEAARLAGLQGLDVAFVLAGDGVDSDRVQALAGRYGVSNLYLVGRVPAQIGAALLRSSDVSLLHLRETALSLSAVPSKLAAYLFAGSPTLIAGEGAVAQLATEAKSGLVVASGDAPAIVNAVQELASAGPCELARLGRSGNTFYTSSCSRKRGIDSVVKILQSLL